MSTGAETSLERYVRAIKTRYLQATFSHRRGRVGPGRPHALPGTLMVSLTSYPPRFPTLALTLKSLLNQTVRPNRLVCWVAHQDEALLPHDVRALQEVGVEIATCDDLGSYKKIIPALELDPETFIIIADDDAYYPPDWLGEIAGAFIPDRREVICNRAHRIRLGGGGIPLPYSSWEPEIRSTESSRLNFPTGIGGVLYAPGILPTSMTCDRSKFLKLCPRGDDIWLFWMAALHGATFRRAGRFRRPITWVGSQRVGLHVQNTGSSGGNDAQVASMIEAFGFPGAGS